MNILSVNKYFWLKGGSEAVFFGEKELLESSGHTVIPFCMAHDNNLQSDFSQYFVDEVDYGKRGLVNKIISSSKVIYSFDARDKIKRVLDAYDVDVSHFHIFQHQISPSVFSPIKSKGIPIILTLHDLKPLCPNYKMYVKSNVCEQCKGHKYYHSVLNKCNQNSFLKSSVNTVEMYFHNWMGYYKNVDAYIAVSNFYRSKMIEYGFHEDKVHYLPNYVSTEGFDPSMEDHGYVLYFGRLSSEKGIMTFLKAAAINSQIDHYVVGTGPLETEIREYCGEKALKNVHILGFKSGPELKKLINQSACTVIASEWYENCPMSVLESYAAGRLVIGSNIGGIPELIEENIDGFTFSPGDFSELAEKISWVFENKPQAKEMGFSGYRKVLKNFNKEAHLQKLLEIYKSVTSSTR